MERQCITKMPIITVHVDQQDKDVLQELANKDRVCLSTYCRLLLAKHAQEYRNAKAS